MCDSKDLKKGTSWVDKYICIQEVKRDTKNVIKFYFIFLGCILHSNPRHTQVSVMVTDELLYLGSGLITVNYDMFFSENLKYLRYWIH